MKKVIISSLALMATVAAVQAQTTEELLKFSQPNFGIVTARSAGMAGAFTSLGADAVSMSINPAGIAMYTRSEITITPNMRFNNTINSYTGMNSTNDHTNKFSIGNIAGVYSNGAFSIGVGYNRLADFYSNSVSYGSDQDISITDMFAEQLYGINNKDIEKWSQINQFPPIMWGSILAYQTGSVIPYGNYNDLYSSLLNRGDLVAPSLATKTDGAIDEFTLSGGYNFDDFLYIGLSLNTQTIKYSKLENYQESGLKGNSGDFDFLDHNRYTTMSGTGFNFKIGATIRPVDWLRIGISYHSPNWTTIHSQYDEDMSSYTLSGPTGGYYQNTDLRTNSYDIYTPSKLLGGISATLAKRVIIAFDYQRTWYRSMGFKQSFDEYLYTPTITANAVDNNDALLNNMDKRGFINMNQIIKDSYRATNTYSLGVEGQVAKGLFLRAGYMYQDSPYADSDLREYGTISQFSAGLGYRNRFFSIDFAYVNSTTSSLPYKYYYYSVQNGNNTYTYTPEGLNSVKNVTQYAIMTLGFRF